MTADQKLNIAIVIPATFTGEEGTYPVTAIGDSAFLSVYQYRYTLLDFTDASHLISIGNKAFYECSYLTGNLKIPNTVKNIGEYVFYNCNGLSGDLIIPDSVMNIGKYTFYNCYGFEGTLTLPNNSNFTKITQYLFYNCHGFTGSLTIPNSVTDLCFCQLRSKWNADAF